MFGLPYLGLVWFGFCFFWKFGLLSVLCLFFTVFCKVIQCTADLHLITRTSVRHSIKVIEAIKEGIAHEHT